MAEPELAFPSFRLDGRVALVSGASRGIGRALALGLASAGADVALAARSADALEKAAGRIRAWGRRAEAIELDVLDGARLPAAVERTVAALGRLDILVNNAGQERVADSLEVSETLWDRILDVNLKSAFFLSQAAARAMPADGGAILNVCSLTSSKSGLLGMTRALAVEWAGRGIRVNAIGPGYFRTALTEPFYQDPAWQEAMLGKIPLRRFGRLEDLLGAAIYLCSDAAAYVTGQILYVDGGYLASI